MRIFGCQIRTVNMHGQVSWIPDIHGSQCFRPQRRLLVNEKKELAYGEFKLICYLVDKLHILLFWQQVNNILCLLLLRAKIKYLLSDFESMNQIFFSFVL